LFSLVLRCAVGPGVVVGVPGIAFGRSEVTFWLHACDRLKVESLGESERSASVLVLVSLYMAEAGLKG